jgi:glycosyltransferase involved in cell wall biosynthesis
VREEYPQARLMLVGNGILRDDLEDHCESLGIRDDVRFMGLVPYQKIPDMLAAMDCLIHTSLREGLARVIPQAQAAGRPAISYDIDGAPEAIDDGETGFLVEPETVEPLAKKMIKISQNSDLRMRMINQARKWVQPKFDWRYMVSEIKSVYDRYE